MDRRVIFGLYCLTFLLQSFMFINWDVSFLLHSSTSLLAGGRYSTDFFETNPPMILYIYTVPVLLERWLSVDLEVVFRLFVLILCFFSISFCQVVVSAPCIAPILAALFLLLPAHEFGQREHLCMVMVMPYVFVLAQRLANKAVPRWMMLVAGFMAGIGFVIKPFFLIPLLIFELYAISQDRRLAIRIESIVIIGVMVAYLASVFVVAADYIYVVAPLLRHFYYAGFGEKLHTLVLRPGVLFCVAALVFYALAYEQDDYAYLVRILWLGVIGFLLSYLLEGTLWYYHLLPGVGFAALLAAIVFNQFKYRNWTKRAEIKVLIVGSLIFCFPIGAIAWFNSLAIADRQIGWREHILEHVKANYNTGTSWYLISTRDTIFPVFEKAGLVSTLRFPNFWWMPGLMKLKMNSTTAAQLTNLKAKETYLVNLIADDLQTRAPRIVLVDHRKYDAELNLENFDYVSYLSQSQKFQEVWRTYRYLETMEPFQVYERVTR